MKKIIPVALVIGAAPALVLGQFTADCPEERCHVAPYFQNTGGFVGEAANEDDLTTMDVDESEVTFSLICANRLVTGRATPDSAGIVRVSLNAADGYDCRAENGGTVEIEGLKHGGWYWITDTESSAVGALIPKDILGNEQIEPTDPGGVILRTVEGGAATFAKHTPSGRVGIIPHIIPKKPLPACTGAVGEASAADCHLGSASEWVLEASPPRVIRPTGSDAAKEVAVTLTGANFLTTGTVYATADADFHTSVEAVTLESRVGEAPGDNEPGVLRWTLTIGADDDRCLPTNPDRLNEQTVTISVASIEEVIPPLGEGIEMAFTINCADDSAASLGAALVPENPFPVNE